MWDYYNFPRAAPRPKAMPGKERKKFGVTWWGKKWVDILSKYEDDQRMSRGRAYARANKIKKFKVKEGAITATVEGSSGNYQVIVKFKKYNNKEWANILQKLNKTPIILGSLLNNEMHENMDECLGCSLVPNSFNSECNCLDYANPCKHIAAVFYALADEIDFDPLLLFKIRGMGKEEILSKLGMIKSLETPLLKEIKTKDKKVKRSIKNKIKKKTIIKNMAKNKGFKDKPKKS